MTKVVKVDLNSVKSTLKEIDNYTTRLCLNLLVEAEFMKKTLKKLKKEINTNGVITKMSQGNYEIERANPALAQYNSLVKNYNSTIKQILDILPKEDPSDDGFEEDEL